MRFFARLEVPIPPLRVLSVFAALSLGALAVPALALAQDIPRTASGRPDLSGTFNAATLTPLQRPVELADKAFLTKEQVEELREDERVLRAKALKNSSEDRAAPAVGGAAVLGFEENPEDGNALGAGNVGGYNWFWVDRGDDAMSVDGEYPTSILTLPADGRLPELSSAAKERAAALASWRRPNDGSAWWLDLDGPAPYDDPESRSTSERCLLGFTGATPTFPSLYNNYKRIVQTEDHVMILIEMVHDARIVRMNSEHPETDVRKWLGDSIGFWEGDTLVVDTTNFHPLATMRGVSENAHVVERFTRQPDGNVHYAFKVEDASMWMEPWGGEYVWVASDQHVYEYACHEGNYSMGGTLRGARLLEREALANTGSEATDRD